ncbi:MAG: MBL fold metallo-hydrolase [Vicinamibacterales bacterium]
MKSRTRSVITMAAILSAVGSLASVSGQRASSTVVGGLEVLQVRPNFYMIAGAGANIGVQVGPDGVIVVDAGAAAKADAVLAAIKTLSDQPIRYVIDTSAGPDHVGGNEKLAKAGQTLFNTDNNALRLTMTNGGAATVISTEKVLLRMSAPSAGVPAYPPAALATEPFFERRRVMYFNGEGIEMLHQPAAHSDGDAMVFFRRSDVVMAGEVLDTTRFPVIDLAQGGSVQGEIDALNRLMQLAIPSVPFDWRDDGTVVIPARGRICDQIDVADYRDMVTVVRDRIRELIKEGKTLAQVQAASPTAGFTKRYGTDSGPWTTKMFVEAVFTSLTQEGRR